MRKRELLGRVALISLGVLLALVVLELALQVGALVVAATGSEVSSTWVTGGRRVLCLGDSNTFGVYLQEREREAYPGQLEQVWRERGRTPPIEVLNAGYPGTNSSLLRSEFPGMLEALQPDVAVVMVGVNDFWTAPVTVDPEEPGGVVDFLRQHSRVFRSYALLRRRLGGAALEVTESANRGLEGGTGVVRFGDREFRLGWERSPGSVRGAWRDLERNLAGLAEEAARARVELVLMTYPSSKDAYAAANRAILRAVRVSGTTLVDLQAVFRSRCAERDCADWLHPDQHPRAAGHRLIAETLVEQLAASHR